jgi:hypothetical protein
MASPAIAVGVATALVVARFAFAAGLILAVTGFWASVLWSPPIGAV